MQAAVLHRMPITIDTHTSGSSSEHPPTVTAIASLFPRLHLRRGIRTAVPRPDCAGESPPHPLSPLSAASTGHIHIPRHHPSHRPAATPYPHQQLLLQKDRHHIHLSKLCPQHQALPPAYPVVFDTCEIPT